MHVVDEEIENEDEEDKIPDVETIMMPPSHTTL